VMGGDNIVSVDRWHNGIELLREFQIWVYPRPGTDATQFITRLTANNPTKGNVYIADAPQNPNTTTQITSRLAEAEKENP
ncbi:MAG: hypothetical protein II112_05995, partial [Bacteroidales bacterium]|nr:hypothetical protein [Bacteroidales bacterium]